MDSKARIGSGGIVLRAAVVRFRSCAAGATSIEYALIAVLFAVCVIATWNSVGSNVGKMYNHIGTSVVNAN